MIAPDHVMSPAEAQAIRHRHGMNVSQWAVHCGVTRQTVHNWEAGRQPVRGAALRLFEMLAAQEGKQ